MILTLCLLIWQSKCGRYFPANAQQSQTYGDICVTNKSVSSSQHLIARRILEVKDRKVLPLECENVKALPVESFRQIFWIVGDAVILPPQDDFTCHDCPESTEVSVWNIFRTWVDCGSSVYTHLYRHISNLDNLQFIEGWNCLFHLECGLSQSQEPPLTVVHYEYLDWPDHFVPTSTRSVRELIRALFNIPPQAGPFLVHCRCTLSSSSNSHYCRGHSILSSLLPNLVGTWFKGSRLGRTCGIIWGEYINLSWIWGELVKSPLCYADSPVLLAFISLNQCIKLVLSHDVIPEYRMEILHFFYTSRLWVFEDIFFLDTVQVYIPFKDLHTWLEVY